MALVCQCPTCGLFVMSPLDASTEDEVRCPHCAAIFTLGNAVEVSLPRLIRIQQKRQESHTHIHDTTEEVLWRLWTDLVVDETSLAEEVPPDESLATSPEVHVVESETSDEGSFLTTVAPNSEADSVHGDDALFDFVIEGEEASKIIGTQELQLDAEEASTREEKGAGFDLAFDETLLEEDDEEDEDTGEAPDMFDFEAEAGELDPGEFSLPSSASESQTTEGAAVLVETLQQRPLPRPSRPVQNPMAMVVARVSYGRKRKNRTLQSLLIGLIGIVALGSSYYGLNYLGGEEFDLFGIPLPGCPHTYGEEADMAVATSSLDEEESSHQGLLAKYIKSDTSSTDGGLSLGSGNVIAYRPVSDSGSTVTGVGGTSTSKNPDLFVDSELFIPNFNADKPRAEFRLAEGEVGLLHYPLFDVRELEATLKATHEEFGCAECKSTGYVISPKGEKVECSYCMGHPANMMSTMGYRYFCQLGQVATLFTDDSPRAVQARRDVKAILKRVATTQTEYHELCMLTRVKLEKPLHSYEGIMVAGRVRVVKPNNGLYGAVIGLPDSDQRITVISDHPFDFEAGDRVAMLGSAILDPAKSITGYDANKPWVIWYGNSITLPKTLSEKQ